MPIIIDEVEWMPHPTPMFSMSPQDHPEETVAHIRQLLDGLRTIELSQILLVPSGTNYGFCLYELLSITPGFLHKDIRPLLEECAQILQYASFNLHNKDFFCNDGKYYQQMRRVSIFIAAAIGYPLFSEDIPNDLVLSVIELQQNAFLQFLLPFCDQPQVYTVVNELVVCNKSSKLFCILTTCLLEEFRIRVMYKCKEFSPSLVHVNELNDMELWCSLLRSLIKSLPPSQDLAPLAKALQPYFPLFLKFAASKDAQLAFIFLPLISDIFNTFGTSSLQLPESIFAVFNMQLPSFLTYISTIPSCTEIVRAQLVIDMLCSATLLSGTHNSIAALQIFSYCVSLCLEYSYNALMSSTVRFCKQIMAQNNAKLNLSVQSLTGTLIQEIFKINVRWFALELLFIACQSNFSTIPKPARSQVKRWARRIPPPVSFGEVPKLRYRSRYRKKKTKNTIPFYRRRDPTATPNNNTELNLPYFTAVPVVPENFDTNSLSVAVEDQNIAQAQTPSDSIEDNKDEKEVEELEKTKSETELQEQLLIQELKDYREQLRLAKLEKDIAEYNIQKELQEREMEIASLMAQKELQMQESILQFEAEIKERNNIQKEILNLQAKRKAYDIELECSPPEWLSERGWEVKEPAILYTFKLVKDRLETVSHKSVTVQIAPKPFARGSFRLAFWMKVWMKNNYEQFVAKQPILANEEQDMTYCKQDILTQLYAAEMAQLFCAFRGPHRVAFVPIYLICFSTRPKKVYMTIEKVLDGEWKRYSNNKGFVHTLENADAVHAFSHFSYVHSCEPKKIVVDLQGVKQANSFILTDPSVHCEKLRIFADSNLGQEGIDAYFKTHICNPVCHSLKLPPNPLQE